MANYDLLYEILPLLNDARISQDLNEIEPITSDDISVNHYYYDEFKVKVANEVIHDDSEEHPPFQEALAEFNAILSDNTRHEYQLLMSKHVTSLSIDFFVQEVEGDPDAAITMGSFKLVNKLLEVEPLGPLIDNSYVLQGHILLDNYSIACCKVEFAPDEGGNYEEIGNILPSDMIINSDDDGREGFSIPVTLSNSQTDGVIRLSLSVTPKDNLSSENGNYFDITKLIPTITMVVKPSHQYLEGFNDRTGEGIQPIVAIKVATSSEGIGELNNDGYEIVSMSINSDATMNLDAMHWNFAIGVMYGDPGEPGIDDVKFVSKENGEDLNLPEGFEVDGTNILASHPDSQHELYLCYHKSSYPRYSKLALVTTEEDNEIHAENLFQNFVDVQGGGEVVLAPSELNQLLSARACICLLYNCTYIKEIVRPLSSPDVNNFAFDSPNLPQLDFGTQSQQGNASSRQSKVDMVSNREKTTEDDIVSRLSGDGGSRRDSRAGLGGAGGGRQQVDTTYSDEEDEEDVEYVDDDYGNLEETTASLAKQLTELEYEKERLLSQNTELQKRAAGIIARIGRDSQQSRGVLGGVNENEVPESNNENTSEKENLFNDSLRAIQEGRSRLLRQQEEYDQLALELQTKLDDKEFKAEDIAESLREFKREILSKAENSRTGKVISKRLIKHYEMNEKNKDSELEKVRLRNISLKTNLRKLEKTLRSREQLAEGLHMIDFEQLKIENQTLSEKIEERNEELAKLKRKKTVTVQILTHIREKLKHVETQNGYARDTLYGIDKKIVSERSLLTVSKHDRENIRDENVELKRQRGFATSNQLIVDFEKRKTTIESLQFDINELKERHFMLTKQIQTSNSTLRKLQTAAKKRSGGGIGMFPPIHAYN